MPLESAGETRRLAAILSADAVGYSRLIAADEAGTRARLKARGRGEETKLAIIPAFRHCEVRERLRRGTKQSSQKKTLDCFGRATARPRNDGQVVRPRERFASVHEAPSCPI
jgi:hypothetical protein